MHPNDGRVVSNFIVQAIKGEPITIYGDGGQTRSFCYVDDLIDGILKLMNTTPHFTGPVNLGNASEFTMNELAEMIKNITGSKSELIYKSLPTDDPKQRRPDTSLANIALAWSPKVEVVNGLAKTVKYFEEYLKINN
jgi:UDP-glucuronate decarboxylase